MIAVAVCYFVAGSLLGAGVLHFVGAKQMEVATTSADIAAPEPSVAAAAQPVPLNRFSAKVVGITDGDTVDVTGPGGAIYAIRLTGIDAPEQD
jgi:endonuclease YncB( thermonuclease family)